jgi:hypothetical protein
MMANHAEKLREERRQAKVAAGYFLRACQTGDEQALYNAAAMLDETYGGWTVAMRAMTRQIQSVCAGVRHAFIQIWIERKMSALTINDHRAMCDAARILLPPYQGLAVQLFRGASAQERRRGTYGLSWTPDIGIAEDFARRRQQWQGGSVVLKTLAPPAAIICAIDYPEPFTVEELKQQFKGCRRQRSRLWRTAVTITSANISSTVAA